MTPDQTSNAGETPKPDGSAKSPKKKWKPSAPKSFTDFPIVRRVGATTLSMSFVSKLKRDLHHQTKISYSSLKRSLGLITLPSGLKVYGAYRLEAYHEAYQATPVPRKTRDIIRHLEDGNRVIPGHRGVLLEQAKKKGWTLREYPCGIYEIEVPPRKRGDLH